MALMLQFWQQWSGTNSINYYSQQIFKSIGLSGTSAELFATGIDGVVRVTMTALIMMLAVEQLGRKWCLQVLHWRADDDVTRPAQRAADAWPLRINLSKFQRHHCQHCRTSGTGEPARILMCTAFPASWRETGITSYILG